MTPAGYDEAFEESFCVRHADSRVALTTFPDHCVQSVITSPPYWGLRQYGTDGEIGSECLVSTYFEQLRIVFAELRRIVRRDGTVWLIVGDAFTSGNRRYRDSDAKHPGRGMASRPKTPAGLKDKDLIGLPWRLAMLVQSLGWRLRTEIVWHKPNAIPESVKDRPWRNHEYIFLFANSSKSYFDRSLLKTDLIDGRRSVWSVPVGAGQKRAFTHTAACPIALLEPCILSSTRPGDVILDPFTGSGTTGIAAIRSGRRFWGIDTNVKYVNLAKRRIIDISRQSSTETEKVQGNPRAISVS